MKVKPFLEFLRGLPIERLDDLIEALETLLEIFPEILIQERMIRTCCQLAKLIKDERSRTNGKNDPVLS